MKTRMLLAGAMLAFLTTSAMAEQNFVTRFLDRYKAPTTIDPAAVSNGAVPQQTLDQLIRGGSLPLTVSDVVQLMIASNLDIRVNRFSPLDQRLFLETLLRPFEPTLLLSGVMTRNSSPTVSQLVASNFLTHRYIAQFAQNFTTGTGVSVTATMNRNSDNNQFNTFNPSYNGTLIYRVTQNMLRDFGRDINLRTLRLSRNNKAQSDVQFEIDLIALVTSAQQMYWDLVASREDIKVKQQSLDLARKTYTDNKRQVEIGTLAPIDVVQTEANVASREEQIVVSTYTSDQLQDRIKKLITAAGDPAMVLARLTPTEAVHRPSAGDLMPIEEAIQYALENRPEMRQVGLSLQNNDIDLQYQKNQLLPALQVNAGFTQSGVGGKRLDFDRQVISTGGLGDALSGIFDYGATGYSVGFNVSIPLSNKSQKAEYSRVMAQKQSNEARRTALAQGIALDVRNAYSTVDMNRARITAAEKSRILAERQLEAEQKKFQLGSGQIRFVLEEQTNLTAAQTNEIQSYVNYTKALVDFDRAIGRTLKRNNIQVDSNQNIALSDSQPRPLAVGQQR